MMHREQTFNESGTIKIHKNVIASIASLAAAEIEGVKHIGKDIAGGILEMIGKKPLTSIKVEFVSSDEVNIDIPVVVKYGYKVPDVAGKVQDNVRQNVENMTDLSVRNINVIIQSVERG